MSGNLAAHRSDVAASSADVRTAYFTFLTAALYLAVAVGATTHEHLLIETRVPLPLAGVDLPIVGFYVVAPVLFLILHFNLLLQFRLLAGKTHRLKAGIEKLRVAGERADEWTLLPAFAFVQMVAGRPDGRTLGGLLRLTMWLTVVWAPALVLLAALVRFLPYHSEAVTWWHRVLILVDLLLLWLLWRGSLWHRSQDARRRGLQTLKRLWTWLGLGTLSLLLVACLAFATLPGESIEQRLASISSVEKVAGGREVPWLTWWLLERRESPLARNLRLHETSLAGDVDLQTKSVRHDLRNRDLRYAELTGADLRRVDLRNAVLDGALLSYARLEGALLTDASLKKANLSNARLEGAGFKQANLRGANLREAALEGANLSRANLRYAELSSAWLLGANLRGARLAHADLRNADLRGGDLTGALLCHAMLDDAELEAADLRDAWVLHDALADGQGALRSLDQADLRGLKECGDVSPFARAQKPRALPSALECHLAKRLISLIKDDPTGAITVGVGRRIHRLARTGGKPETPRTPEIHVTLTAAAIVGDRARIQHFAEPYPRTLRSLRALAQQAGPHEEACAGAAQEEQMAENALRW